jgi:hypothetical protein
MARGPDDRARHRHHRGRRARLRHVRFSIAAERSVLVPGLRRGDGHGLALVRHHDVGHGRAQARTESTRARAWLVHLRRARPPFAPDARRTARDWRSPQPGCRIARADQPAHGTSGQQRHRRWIPDLSAHFRAGPDWRMGGRPAGSERGQRHCAPVSLALRLGPRLHRRATHRHRRRVMRRDSEPGRHRRGPGPSGDAGRGCR